MSIVERQSQRCLSTRKIKYRGINWVLSDIAKLDKAEGLC